MQYLYDLTPKGAVIGREHKQKGENQSKHNNGKRSMHAKGVDATPLSMYVTKPLKCPLATHTLHVVKTWQFQSK